MQKSLKALRGTEHCRADGIVEDVLDRNGEESSKSCGAAGYLLTFFKELKAKEKKEEETVSPQRQ